MAEKLHGKLPSIDDLFSDQTTRDDARLEKVMDIEISSIRAFRNHPFKVLHDASMQEMTESVGEYGVLVPALVRPTDNGYEMVSGHRRMEACKLAGKSRIPAIVRELTDDEAVMIMVDSNLQREKILPSEKAFAYKMKLEAMNRQGQRTDLTFSPLGKKYSHEQLVEETGESKNQIFRYIRLTELIPTLLQMVDDGKIAFRPAVEISYLSKEHQTFLLETMQCEDCTPSHAQAMGFKQLSRDGLLTEDRIFTIMSQEKPNQREKFSIPRERIARYFKQGTPREKIEETIIKALELYQKRERGRGR